MALGARTGAVSRRTSLIFCMDVRSAVIAYPGACAQRSRGSQVGGLGGSLIKRRFSFSTQRPASCAGMAVPHSRYTPRLASQLPFHLAKDASARLGNYRSSLRNSPISRLSDALASSYVFLIVVVSDGALRYLSLLARASLSHHYFFSPFGNSARFGTVRR